MKKKIEEAVKRIPADSFTVLDFIDEFRATFPRDWKTLAEGFGLFDRITQDFYGFHTDEIRWTCRAVQS